MAKSTPHNIFYMKHYGPLIGKTVKSLTIDETADTGDGEPLFGLLFTDGTIAWILSDEEGNGSGFLDIVKKS